MVHYRLPSFFSDFSSAIACDLRFDDRARDLLRHRRTDIFYGGIAAWVNAVR